MSLFDVLPEEEAKQYRAVRGREWHNATDGAKRLGQRR